MNTTLLIVGLCFSFGSVISLPGNWKNRQLKNPNAADVDTCTNCKEILAGVIARLETVEGVTMVEQFLNNEICAYLSPYVSYESCSSAVQALVPGLLQYVVENADPEVWCSMAHLCPETLTSQFKTSTKSSVQTGDDACTNCKEVVAGFIVNLDTVEVKESVERYINDVVCSTLSAYFLEEICTAEVRALIPEVLNYIVENMDPEEVCTVATLCPEEVGEKPSNTLFTNTFVQKDDDSCANCKEIIAGVIARLVTEEGVCSSAVHPLAPGLLRYVVANADDNACTNCEEAVASFIASFDTVEVTDPEDVCPLATLCPEKSEDLLLRKPFVQQGDNACTNCKEVVSGFIVSLDTDEAKCTAEVRALIPEVLNYIVENVDPEEVCTLATLCPEKGVEKSADLLFTNTVVQQDVDTCTNCKEILAGVIARLETVEGVTMVEQFLNNEICVYLSPYVSYESCSSAVQALVPGLLQYVVENAGDDACTNCKEVVAGFIVNLDTVEVKCTAEVRALIQEVLNYIVENLDPEEVCTVATLCPEEVGEKPSNTLFTNTFVQKTHVLSSEQ
ncbi:prosaposin-like [Haliotis asinina]|uniref:prosaposin-like n=1 Tax=Haliotis asinina TaxID=109174 RepID=UPI003532032C